jgi:hypothetical protein
MREASDKGTETSMIDAWKHSTMAMVRAETHHSLFTGFRNRFERVASTPSALPDFGPG